MGMWSRPLTVLFLCLAVLFFDQGSGQQLSRRQLVDRLLNSSRYDPHIVPDFDEEYPTNVTVQITIHNMHSISETSMEYSLDVYLRLWWRDDRLDFQTMSNISKLELDSRNIDSVWQPDVFFENENRAQVHTVTKSNRLMHIHRNGTVVYSIRFSIELRQGSSTYYVQQRTKCRDTLRSKMISLTLSCTMNLQYYPFDSQTCPLIIQSFGYTKDNINLNWHSSNGITAEKLELPQFELLDEDISTSDYEASYSSTGIFSTLKAELPLHRKVGFYFLQVFIPSIFLVVLSWVSFWVDAHAVPARVSLGVTCVLTMTTQSAGTRQTLPPVSYVKAIDIWMFVCLLFVFAALLEFAYVNVLLRRKQKDGTKRKKETVIQKAAKEIEMDTIEENGWRHGKLGLFKKMFSRDEDEDEKGKPHRVDCISRFVFPSCFVFFLFVFFMVCGLS